MRNHWSRRTAAGVLAAGLLLAGCSSDGGDAADEPADDASTETTEAVVDEVGVTEDSVKLGVLILASESAAAALGEQEAQWTSAVDALNAAGGIDGRTVEVVFRPFDGFVEDDMRAACLELTEDEEVFAVASVYGYDPAFVSCITEEHDTTFLGYQISNYDEQYEAAPDRLFSVTNSAEDVMRKLAADLDGRGMVEGESIAVVSGTIPSAAIPIDNGLLPQLDELGIEPVTTVAMGNAAEVGSQAPSAANDFKASGATMLIGNPQPLQTMVLADATSSIGYTPTYVLSDVGNSVIAELAALLPPALQGSLGFTAFRTGEAAAGLEAVPADAECAEQYEASTGTALDPAKGEYGMALGACALTTILAEAGAIAGANLTRDTFAEGVFELGEIELAYVGPGSFAPGKNTYADSYRYVALDTTCKCWVPQEEFGVPEL